LLFKKLDQQLLFEAQIDEDLIQNWISNSVYYSPREKESSYFKLIINNLDSDEQDIESSKLMVYEFVDGTYQRRFNLISSENETKRSVLQNKWDTY
jgi:hypothetical protein